MTNGCWVTNAMLCVVALIGVSFVIHVIIPSVLTGSLNIIKTRYNKSGKAWALVTGTTSGIGASFVKILVELGFNVVMIARNEDKLKQCKSELEQLLGHKKSVRIEYFVVDLARRECMTNELHKFISSNEISVLINNAGLNTEYPKLFIENTKEELESILDVNCRSMTLLTHAILPSMVHRRNGLVINMSSLFGLLSGPLVSAYSGTKNYIDAFSLSLSEELRGSGVRVFCSLPGFVVSNMSKIKRASFTVMSADACVRSILGQIAGNNSLVIASPHWTHATIGWFMSTVIPSWLRLRILGSINRGTNQAALRKAAKLGAR
jgi:17beta-estradiol 17-dehydrogenase / very-long-chain 3-oxoacyl-CoA reductase